MELSRLPVGNSSQTITTIFFYPMRPTWLILQLPCLLYFWPFLLHLCISPCVFYQWPPFITPCLLIIVPIVSISYGLLFFPLTLSKDSVFLLFHRTMRGKRHSTVQRSTDTLRWFQCFFRSSQTPLWETTDKRLPSTWQRFMDAFRLVRMKYNLLYQEN